MRWDGFKVFGYLKYGRTFARYAYSKFCRNAPQMWYLEWEQVKKQMNWVQNVNVPLTFCSKKICGVEIARA
jgi:hypothetical protein